MKQTLLSKRTQNRVWLGTAALSLGLAAHAALYTFNGSPAQTIPDNNPSGVAYAFDFTDTEQIITDVTVSLSISGGWNGDLYAYLAHGPDVLILLDRVGVSASSAYGYGDAGFSITLSDAGSVNIHNYGGNGGSQLTGTFKPDGQTTSPFASPSSFSATGGSGTFANIFANSDPNGSWSLFFVDVSGGSVSTLNSWSVDITAVPEPVTHLSLGVILVLFGVARALRVRAQRK